MKDLKIGVGGFIYPVKGGDGAGLRIWEGTSPIKD
jgi:hypothetical protein